MMDNLRTVRQIATAAGVDRGTVLRDIKKGKLHASRIGSKQWFVEEGIANEYVRERLEKKPPPPQPLAATAGQ